MTMVARNQLYPPCTTLPTDEGWIPALQAERDALKAEVARLAEALRKMEERAEQAEQNQWHEHEALGRAERERDELARRCTSYFTRAESAERSARLAEERAGRLEVALRKARRAMIVSVIGISDGLTIYDIREWIAEADSALDQPPAPTCK